MARARFSVRTDLCGKCIYNLIQSFTRLVKRESRKAAIPTKSTRLASPFGISCRAKGGWPDVTKLEPVFLLKYVPTEDLRLNPKNPRQHSEKQIQQIANSIQTFGFSVPIGVDANLTVIYGHGRVLAAR
jgi:ParB-like nuclease domain